MLMWTQKKHLWPKILNTNSITNRQNIIQDADELLKLLNCRGEGDGGGAGGQRPEDGAGEVFHPVVSVSTSNV